MYVYMKHLVLQHCLQLLLDNTHTKLVAAVDYKNDGLRVFIIVFPQISVFARARHVENC